VTRVHAEQLGQVGDVEQPAKLVVAVGERCGHGSPGSVGSWSRRLRVLVSSTYAFATKSATRSPRCHSLCRSASALIRTAAAMARRLAALKTFVRRLAGDAERGADMQPSSPRLDGPQPRRRPLAVSARPLGRRHDGRGAEGERRALGRARASRTIVGSGEPQAPAPSHFIVARRAFPPRNVRGWCEPGRVHRQQGANNDPTRPPTRDLAPDRRGFTDDPSHDQPMLFDEDAVPSKTHTELPLTLTFQWPLSLGRCGCIAWRPSCVRVGACGVPARRVVVLAGVAGCAVAGEPRCFAQLRR